MAFITIIISYLLAVQCRAQQDFLAGLPNCALECLTDNLSITTCQPTDLACLCTDQSFMLTVGGCNAQSCSVVEVLSATNATYAACGLPVGDQSTTLRGICFSFGSVATFMIAVRIVYRTFSGRLRLGWDDLLIATSGISAVGMNVGAIGATYLGFGRDTWTLTPSDLTGSLKWMYPAYILFMLGEFLCQMSILAFYLRIMVDAKLRWATWAMMALVAAFGVSNTIVMIFQCTPIHLFWDGWRMDAPGTCIDARLYAFIRGGMQIFIDLAILSLPLPMLAKLQMSLKRKAQIMSMFCVGFVITVVSCLRLSAFVEYANTQNPIHDNSAGLYWSVIECNLYQIVACMPTIPALIYAIARPWGFLSSRTRSNGATRGEPNRSSCFGSKRDQDDRPDSFEIGIINKSTDVKVHRSDRSDSDAELASNGQRIVGWEQKRYRS